MSEELHACAAKGCVKEVPHGVLMCRMHWVMIPGVIQSKIYDAFRADQNSEEYVAAVREAIDAVRDKERQRKKHAAEERHAFREAWTLLYEAIGFIPPERELAKKINEFLTRHKDG